MESEMWHHSDRILFILCIVGLLAMAAGIGAPLSAVSAPTFVTKWGSYGNYNGQFSLPQSVAVSPDGWVFVADTANNRIEKFTSTGSFMTAWGQSGNGDGQFNGPGDIATDSSGYVYVIDNNNRRIQKFSPSGSYVDQWGSSGSGDGQFEYANGIAITPTGKVYVSDGYYKRIQEFTLSGDYVGKWGSGGTGDGQFSGDPTGVATDADGNIYVIAGNRISKFTSSYTYVTNWGSSGSGDGQFNNPRDIAVDASGNVNVLDTGNNRIEVFSSSGAYEGKWGLYGSTNGLLNSPKGLAITPGGDIYVADTSNHRIQRFFRFETPPTAPAVTSVSPKSGPMTGGTDVILTGSGFTQASVVSFGSLPTNNITVLSATRIRAKAPAQSAGKVYITVTTPGGTSAVSNPVNFTFSGYLPVYTSKWGSYGTYNGQFRDPACAAVGPDGSIFVTDTNNHRVQRFSADGGFITEWTSDGSEAGQLQYPYALAVDSEGSVYVGDTYDRILKFTSSGEYLTYWGTSGNGDAQFGAIQGIAVSPDGTVYVADGGNHRVQRFTSSGAFVEKWGTYGTGDGQFTGPNAIAIGSDGSVYVLDGQRIRKFTSAGICVTNWGSSGSADGQFSNPRGIALDAGDNVYVTDTSNNRIELFSSSGAYKGKWGVYGSGSGQFSSPQGIAVNPSDDIYITETGNDRIQIFSPVAPPTVSKATPTSAYRNTTVSFSVTGTRFHPDATIVQFRNQTTGVIGTVLTSITTTRINGTVAIPATAVLGVWNVRVTTSPGGTATALKVFTIKKFPAPNFTSITPTTGFNATTVKYSIAGTNFRPGLTTVRFRNAAGSTITKNTITSVTATRIAGTLVIPKTSWKGPYNIIISTVDGGTVVKPGGFRVK
jgi:sugar lactone lactonase YvrE